MERTECADFLKTRQLCAGIVQPIVHDTCQVNYKLINATIVILILFETKYAIFNSLLF